MADLLGLRRKMRLSTFLGCQRKMCLSRMQRCPFALSVLRFPNSSNLFISLHNKIFTPAQVGYTTTALQDHLDVPSRATNLREATDLYASLLRECTRRKSLQEVRNVQLQMMNSGFPHLGLGNKLIDAYLKCGGLVDARKVFDELPHRHIVAWNSMIASYIKRAEGLEALGLYQRMRLEGVFPDEFTFSSVFKAFSDLNLVHEVRQAHRQVVVLGLEVSNVFVGSALVDMYAKFGMLKDAQSVADRVKGKDVILFTCLIVGYNQSGEDSQALKVFHRMIKDGIMGNEYTFASILISCGSLGDLNTGKVIHGLTIKSGYEDAIASQTSLLTMYSKCGVIDDSLKVFNLLVNPNQVTWTSLVVGLVHNGREEIALSMFCQMMRSSLVPNSFTLSAVLSACSSLAMLEQGRQLHTIIIKLGLDSQKFTGAALVDLYGKCGCVELARVVYDGLSEPDLVPVNTMMYAYAQNGFGQEALKLFYSMEEMGLEPNDMTLLSVLTACNSMGMVEEGRRIFSSFRSNSNVRITNIHYACMVDLLGRSGKLQEAESLINEIESPDIVLWRTLLSACRIHGEVAIAERVINKVLEHSPRDEGTLVLSSNLYASTCNWSQVIEMKTLMRNIKLKKSPAMTWVDIDREIHTFMAGDWSHPMSKEIHDTLQELIIKAGHLGYIPDTRFVLQDLDKKEKERSLYYHSEKLAIAFSVWKTKNKNTCIRIYKNLRVCGDCHNWIKFVSRVTGRDIVARDAKRFHHFKDGSCSCGDYW